MRFNVVLLLCSLGLVMLTMASPTVSPVRSRQGGSSRQFQRQMDTSAETIRALEAQKASLVKELAICRDKLRNNPEDADAKATYEDLEKQIAGHDALIARNKGGIDRTKERIS